MTTVPILWIRVAVGLTTASWGGGDMGWDLASRRNSSRAVAKMRDARRGPDDAGRLEVAGDVLEEPRAAAEQDRRDVDLHLLDDAGAQVLLRDVGPAADRDVLVAGRLARLRERRLGAVCDERERAAGQDERLARVVGEDEHRVVEGRLVAPPAVRLRIVLPRARAAAEHL